MVSFDQVLLLQKKVEDAVQKIVQLKSENDALRNKCSELTNALSEKTELLNSFTADEKKIEDSILGALDRLNSIENSIVSQNGLKEASVSEASTLPKSEPVISKPQTNQITEESPAAVPQTEEINVQPEITEPEISSDESSDDISAPEFDGFDSSDESDSADTEKEEKFDIF